MRRCAPLPRGARLTEGRSSRVGAPRQQFLDLDRDPARADDRGAPWPPELGDGAAAAAPPLMHRHRRGAEHKPGIERYFANCGYVRGLQCFRCCREMPPRLGYRFVHVQLTPAPRVATLHSGQNRSAGARFPAEIRQGDDQIARAKCAGPHFLRINMTKQTPLLGTAAPSSGSSEGQTVGLQTQKQHSTRTWAPTINHRLTFAAFGRLEKETFKGDD